MKRPQQGPRRGLVRTSYCAGARRVGGKAPGVAYNQPDRFRNLYRIAHSEQRWKSGTTSPSLHIFRSRSGGLAMLTAMPPPAYGETKRPDGRERERQIENVYLPSKPKVNSPWQRMSRPRSMLKCGDGQ